MISPTSSVHNLYYASLSSVYLFRYRCEQRTQCAAQFISFPVFPTITNDNDYVTPQQTRTYLQISIFFYYLFLCTSISIRHKRHNNNDTTQHNNLHFLSSFDIIVRHSQSCTHTMPTIETQWRWRHSELYHIAHRTQTNATRCKTGPENLLRWIRETPKDILSFYYYANVYTHRTIQRDCCRLRAYRSLLWRAVSGRFGFFPIVLDAYL